MPLNSPPSLSSIQTLAIFCDDPRLSHIQPALFEFPSSLDPLLPFSILAQAPFPELPFELVYATLRQVSSVEGR